MREQILECARLNTKIASANAANLHILKLDSIENLDSVKDLMAEDARESLEEEDTREYIADDIKSGITFIFWYDNYGKLEFSR